MKRYSIPLISAISICAIFSSSCSSAEQNDPTREKIEEAARRDVAKVADAPKSSMQREQAVLAIKVREYSLRENGYADEADIYISKAHDLLVDSLHIIEDR